MIHSKPEQPDRDRPMTDSSVGDESLRSGSTVAERYQFTSKATGRLILLGRSGEQLLRLIGREPSAAGIIAPASMSTAIEAIATAIAREDVQAQHPSATGALVTDGHDAASGDGVTLRQRAWPLLDMMRRAQRDGEAIFWGV